MVILLLAATAILAGLLIDARRRLAAERTRHAAERDLARKGLVAAHEDTRDALRVAAAWRAHAAELETFAVVLAPHEPQGDDDPAAVTEPRLYGEDASPEDRCGPMADRDCPGCAESGTAGCDLCCASAEPGGAA